MDESKLRYLIENHADYGLKHDRKVKGKPCGDYIARLQKYLDSDRIITYAQSRGHGRMFATQPLSLQSMCKRVRHTICKDLMIDVDMVNAHPTFLSIFCHQNGIPCPQLDLYNSDLKTCLKR